MTTPLLRLSLLSALLLALSCSGSSGGSGDDTVDDDDSTLPDDDDTTTDDDDSVDDDDDTTADDDDDDTTSDDDDTTTDDDDTDPLDCPGEMILDPRDAAGFISPVDNRGLPAPDGRFPAPDGFMGVYRPLHFPCGRTDGPYCAAVDSESVLLDWPHPEDSRLMLGPSPGGVGGENALCYNHLSTGQFAPMIPNDDPDICPGLVDWAGGVVAIPPTDWAIPGWGVGSAFLYAVEPGILMGAHSLQLTPAGGPYFGTYLLWQKEEAATPDFRTPAQLAGAWRLDTLHWVSDGDAMPISQFTHVYEDNFLLSHPPSDAILTALGSIRLSFADAMSTAWGESQACAGHAYDGVAFAAVEDTARYGLLPPSGDSAECSGLAPWRPDGFLTAWLTPRLMIQVRLESDGSLLVLMLSTQLNPIWHKLALIGRFVRCEEAAAR